MKVRDIILQALRFVGRDDVIFAIDKDDFTEEQHEVLKTMLLCLNAVEDELARRYLPLVTTEIFFSENGEIEFVEFSGRPLKIVSVKTPAGECGFEVTLQKLKTSAGEVTVEYCYAPVPKKLDDDSEYTDIHASVALMAAGTASEFCLISGDAAAANVWEAKYRREIDFFQRKKYFGAKIPPRRWV